MRSVRLKSLLRRADYTILYMSSSFLWRRYSPFVYKRWYLRWRSPRGQQQQNSRQKTCPVFRLSLLRFSSDVSKFLMSCLSICFQEVTLARKRACLIMSKRSQRAEMRLPELYNGYCSASWSSFPNGSSLALFSSVGECFPNGTGFKSRPAEVCLTLYKCLIRLAL